MLDQQNDQCKDISFELLNHLPYSPYLAPNDFHLFGPLKEELDEHKIYSNKEIIEAKVAVHKIENFLPGRNSKLIKKWIKCIEIEKEII